MSDSYTEFQKTRYLEWARNPEWEKVGRVHDWRNYISERVQAMWDTFTDEQKVALVEQADEAADREEWD